MPLGLKSINFGFIDAKTPLVTSCSSCEYKADETEEKNQADIDLGKFKELTKRIKQNTSAKFSLSGNTLNFEIRNKGGQDYEKTLVMEKGEKCLLCVTTSCSTCQRVEGTLGDMNKFIEDILEGKHDKWEMPNFQK